MRNGEAESTVGIPRHQDPNADNDWDEETFVREFLDEDEDENGSAAPILISLTMLILIPLILWTLEAIVSTGIRIDQ